MAHRHVVYCTKVLLWTNRFAIMESIRFTMLTGHRASASSRKTCFVLKLYNAMTSAYK